MAGARQGPGRRLDGRGRVSGSAQHLRRVLRLCLKAWELPFLVDAAELALTELIANVVRHAPDRRGQTLFFRLPRGEGVRVEVADSSPAVSLAITGDPLDDGWQGGRGLVLVNAVTDDWDIVKRWDGGGKTVWFECLTPPESGGSRFRTARPGPRP
ncbi:MULTISPECIES: ATP-binding protein [unclassified Streptomyces]|uniref:ATP-binding protein n=1 Tax=unclassified Streptomyces TaxID=2593676 RepID=UPI0024A93559|nr:MULTISPECIES: ATP-binding protein [unclassified Streptomyces]